MSKKIDDDNEIESVSSENDDVDEDIDEDDDVFEDIDDIDDDDNDEGFDDGDENDEIEKTSNNDSTKNNVNYENDEYDEDYNDENNTTDANDDIVGIDEPLENYLQKISNTLKSNIITQYHPQLQPHNFEEIKVLTLIQRNKYGDIIDEFHKTTPFMTKYERCRILAERTVQLNLGMVSFLENDHPEIIDNYYIALEELKQKKIHFIIQRPLPDGTFEYWNARDLELLI